MENCVYGCCKVGEIFYKNKYNDDDNIENKFDEISKYEAYNAIYSGEFGHENYALPAFCVCNGHLECLKKLHKNKEFKLMWHFDLSNVAIENDNLECLIYILENMGDVDDKFDLNCVGKQCMNYVVEKHLHS